MPLVEWMRNEDQYWRILLEPRTLQRGYFKPAAIKSLINEHLRGRRNRSGVLWRMLVLELWHRNFMESQEQWSTPRRQPDIRNSEVHLSPRPVERVQPRAGELIL